MDFRIDEKKIDFARAVRKVFGDVEIISRPQIIELVNNHNISDPSWLWQSSTHKVGNGKYRIPKQLLEHIGGEDMALTGVESVDKTWDTDSIQFDEHHMAQVPAVDPLYEPFGNYFDVHTITKSQKFFPYWIYGLSGNGKTLSIEQAHAQLKKPMVFIPITKEADEDSLLGGLRLKNGNTVPFFGPVTMAALTGCTAVLDEVDMGDEKMMCLQNALQNRPFLIKRLGKVIHPKPGFNIAATANTKGRGSDDGRFMGANIMNDSSLERYIVTFEQDYPDETVEHKILKKVLESLGHTSVQEEQFVERLILWAKKIRQSHKQGSMNEVITTRRLVHICRAYDMFGKERRKSIERCLARFTDDVRVGFMGFYEAIDADAKKKDAEMEKIRKAEKEGKDPEIPF